MTTLHVRDLGCIGYDEALGIQRELVEAVRNNPAEAYLLLLEHDPPVITLGRRGRAEDILLPREQLAEQGVDIHETSRGGEVTYHGPGQLVGYAICSVDRATLGVRQHVRNLEETLIRVLEPLDIRADRREGLTGVWVGEEKIAAIGVAVHRWVSYHGFALNVTTPLERFGWIVPCGMAEAAATSVEALQPGRADMERIKQAVVERFLEVYGFVRG